MITGVDETENTDIQQLKEELEFVQLAVNQRDNFRIRENVLSSQRLRQSMMTVV